MKVDGAACSTVFDYDTLELDHSRDVHCIDHIEHIKKTHSEQEQTLNRTQRML